jgi:hypothetical protein
LAQFDSILTSAVTKLDEKRKNQESPLTINDAIEEALFSGF